MKEKKEVINLSRRSSGGGWRSDGLGQNFWEGAFREGKIAFIGRQVGSSHVLLSEAYTLDWWLSENNHFVLIVMIFLLFVFIIVSA